MGSAHVCAMHEPSMTALETTALVLTSLAFTLVVVTVAAILPKLSRQRDRRRAVRSAYWMPFRNPRWVSRSDIALTWIATILVLGAIVALAAANAQLARV